jgi:2-polyprenyl-6-methoxyphenol hydroxylase-like FAD-dependent oxidoreductase
MSRELNIVIIGAGLSGLAAAIQCALSGHFVTVLESAKELAEVRSTTLFEILDANRNRLGPVYN